MCCTFITPLQKATGDDLIGRAFYSKIRIQPLICDQSFGTFGCARRSTMRGSRSFAMKKILFAVSAVALALSAGSAMAADLPSRKEAPVYVPPPPPPPMWTGFYGGLNIGGGWDANGGQSGVSGYYDPTIQRWRVRPSSSCEFPQPVLPAQRQYARQPRRRRRRRSGRLQLPVQSVRDWRRDRLSGHQPQRRRQQLL